MPKNKKTTKPKLTEEEREALQYVAQKAELAASLLKSGVQLGSKVATACSKAVQDFLDGR